MKKYFPVIILLFLSCSGSSVPSELLEPQKMYPVVKDIMIADEYINNTLSNDSTINVKKKRSELYEQIFVLHKTDRKQFYKTFKYYQEHPDIQKILFDSLSEGFKKKEIPKKPLNKDLF